MIVIVDGDNAPGANVGKLKELDETDEVIIYYASDNSYYLKEESRKQLEKAAKC